MPYLNLDLDYFTHPKIMRLARLLGPHAVVYPMKLWCYTGKHFPVTGMLEGCSKHDIEQAVNWDGEPGALVDALVKISLLDVKKSETETENSSFKIHDWKQHAGHLWAFKKRAKTAAKKRWKDYASSTATGNAKGCAPNLSSPILTTPNQTVPTKPKKKEKKKIPASPETGLQPVDGKTPEALVWESYAAAYESRYGVEPLRNAAVNSMIVTFVKRVGMVNAPAIAAFYLTHNGRFYVEKMHPLNLLVNDAGKLDTEWKTGNKITSGAVRNAERKDDVSEQFKRIMANQGEEHHG